MMNIHEDRAFLQRELDRIEAERRMFEEAARKNCEIDKRRLTEDDRTHTDGGDKDRLDALLKAREAEMQKQIDNENKKLDAQANDIKAQQQLLEQQQRQAEELVRQDALAQNEKNFRMQQDEAYRADEQRRAEDLRREEEARRIQEELRRQSEERGR